LPVKCRFNLANARCAPSSPAQTLFILSKRKNQSSSFFTIVLRRPRGQVSGKSFAKQWSLDFVPWRLPLQGWLLLGVFALRPSSLSRNRLFEFHKRRQFFIGVHNETLAAVFLWNFAPAVSVERVGNRSTSLLHNQRKRFCTTTRR